jgi:hypothetical protein
MRGEKGRGEKMREGGELEMREGEKEGRREIPK